MRNKKTRMECLGSKEASSMWELRNEILNIKKTEKSNQAEGRLELSQQGILASHTAVSRGMETGHKCEPAQKVNGDFPKVPSVSGK